MHLYLGNAELATPDGKVPALHCSPPAARARQLSRLELLFGSPDQPAALPECIFAYGLAATADGAARWPAVALPRPGIISRDSIPSDAGALWGLAELNRSTSVVEPLPAHVVAALIHFPV